jgi:hypothetical protein
LGYQELFKKFFCFIFSPARAWQRVNHEEQSHDVLSGYVYPLMGLCSLAIFIRYTILYHEQKEVFQYALMECARVFVALFAVYFVAVQVLTKWVNRFKQSEEIPSKIEVQYLAGYGMTMLFVGYFVRAFLPTEYVLLTLLLELYTVVIVKEGFSLWMPFQKQLTCLSWIMSVILILVPEIAARVFTFLQQI